MLPSLMKRIGLVALLAPLMASPLACADPDPAPSAARAGPNVVLIVVDTLRADRLAEFDDERGAGHGLRRFAAEATRFEQDYTGAENITRLYDLQADPGETHDLSSARPGLVRRLTRQLEATQDDLSQRRLASAVNVLDRMDAQALQALGYLH